MKTHTILTIAFALLTSSICSQVGSEMRGKIHVGVKSGINYSSIYSSNNDEYISIGQIGYAGGLFLSVPIWYLGVQTEVLFSQKGFTAKGNGFSLDRKTNYLDIPLFLTVNPNKILTVLVGPQYSYLLAQKDKTISQDGYSTENVEFMNERVRQNTLSIVYGIDINLGRTIIGTRVGWGLFNNNNEGTLTTPHYKNNWGQVTVGIKL